MLRTLAAISVLASSLAVAIAAQRENDSTLTPRQLFYTERTRPAKPQKPKEAPAKPASSPAKSEQPPAPVAEPQKAAPPAYVGLRYSVMQVREGGRLDEVDPDRVFRSGDRIKVKITPNSSGYLYIVHQGSSGNWDVLFPSARTRHGSNAVPRMETVMIPDGDEYDFTFDDKPGSERLFVVLSTAPEADLDSLIYSVRGGSAPKSERVMMASNSVSIPASGIDRFRSPLVARDLRVERRPQVSAGKREEAVYVVNASHSGDNKRVVAEIVLKHQ